VCGEVLVNQRQGGAGEKPRRYLARKRSTIEKKKER
jgi:hypothetical protein